MASSIRAFVARRPRETAPLASADSGRARDRRGRGGAPRALGGALFADIRQSRRAPAPALGARTPRILFHHLLPEILSVIVVLATFDVGRIIILESTLSFLGLGVQPPTPSWGSDLRDAAVYVRQAWWTSVFPGLAIMVVVLVVNLVGDALRDALDPRTQSRARA